MVAACKWEWEKGCKSNDGLEGIRVESSDRDGCWSGELELEVEPERCGGDDGMKRREMNEKVN
jgi:hypothetical protein